MARGRAKLTVTATHAVRTYSPTRRRINSISGQRLDDVVEPRGGKFRLARASATAPHDEFGGQDNVALNLGGAVQHGEQRVDGHFAQDAARLANGGQRGIEVASH